MEKRGGVIKAKIISRWKERYPITDEAMAEISYVCGLQRTEEEIKEVMTAIL